MILLLISHFLLLLVSVGFVSTTWAGICNYRTHIDIMKVIEAMRSRPVSAPALLSALHCVDYNRHLRERFWLRDPWALYAPIVRDALENPRMEVIQGIAHMPVSDEPPPRMN